MSVARDRGDLLVLVLKLVEPEVEAATREKLYAAIVQAPLPSARAAQPALPRDLAVVLAVALDKDPARRYATALDFAEDLRRARELQPILAKPPSPILRLGRWTQRNRALAASLAALALTLCAALGYRPITCRIVSAALGRGVTCTSE